MACANDDDVPFSRGELLERFGQAETSQTSAVCETLCEITLVFARFAFFVDHDQLERLDMNRQRDFA